MPAQGLPVNNLNSGLINYYVAAGEEIEVFSESDGKIIDLFVFGPPPESSEIANEIVSRLDKSRSQEVIAYNKRRDQYLVQKASEVESNYFRALEITNYIYNRIKLARSYFSGPELFSADLPCSVSQVWIQSEKRMIDSLDQLEATDAMLEKINKIFQFDELGAVSTNSEGKPHRPGYTAESLALQSLDSSSATLIQSFEKILTDTISYIKNIEMLLNNQVPPSLLVAIEEIPNCIHRNLRELTKVIECNRGRNIVHCKIEVLQRGTGEVANKLVPIPYIQDGKTLQVRFADDAVFKRGSGLILDISDCTEEDKTLRCPNPEFEADECLETIDNGKVLSELPPSCEVHEVPPSHPLVVPVAEGHLVAQRSEVPMTIEYGDNSVPQGPIIVSNKGPMQITYGREKITVPPFWRDPSDLVYLPKGNFSILEEAVVSASWEKRWSNFFPVDARLILLLMVVLVQILTIWPCLISWLDIALYFCGYEIVPENERKPFRRYRSKIHSDGSHSGYSDGDDGLQFQLSVRPGSLPSIHSGNNPTSAPSDMSSRSMSSLDRVRTLRALENRYC